MPDDPRDALRHSGHRLITGADDSRPRRVTGGRYPAVTWLTLSTGAR